MAPPSRVNIQTIATKAGVCKATVSLALRNHPSLPATTVTRIRAIADELGYQPHPYVSALMSAVSRSQAPSYTATIGFLSDEGPTDFRREPRRHLIIEASRARAAELGYSLEHFWVSEPALTPARLTKILQSRGIFGLLLGYSAKRDPAAPLYELDWSRFACASLSTLSMWPAFHHAYPDHYDDTGVLLDQLKARGYKRIGVAMDRLSEILQKMRFRAAASMHALANRSETLVPVFEPAHFVEETFAKWFKKHRPDVVVSINPEVLDWLKRLGLNVPGDVGFANLSLARGRTRESGMRSDSEFLGACAVDLVDAQLRRNERGVPPKVKTVLVKGIWNEGTTLRPLPAGHPLATKAA